MDFRYASADRGSEVTALAGFGIYPDPMRALDLGALPSRGRKVCLRADAAGYRRDLPLYCGEGEDPRFGVIDFAIGAEALRAAVRSLPEAARQPLLRRVDGRAQWTGQEWAEAPYAPNRAGYSKGRADYRFLATREPPGELDPGDAAQLPFPTEEFEARGRCKLFALATNLTWPADRAIRRHRERCAKSEEAHTVLKRDLAGGHRPSGPFGANAAGWARANLAHNRNALMKRPVSGPAWVARRMKALRFPPIAPPGRVARHARRLVIRLPAALPALDLPPTARRAIQGLARGPSP